MEKRHLFEPEYQQRALREFDGLAKIKQLVDWEVFGPRLEQVFGSGRKQHRRGSPAVGCAGDVQSVAIGCNAWIK